MHDRAPRTIAGPRRCAAVIDAAARVIARCGHRGAKWSLIARELGDPDALAAASWFPSIEALVDACYARTAEGLHDCLLQAETTPGTGLDRIAAFLVAALETRRERGVFLSFRRTGDLPESLQRRVREHDMMIRSRLRRLLAKGRDDGTLAARSLEGVCDLILSVLQSGSPTAGDRPQQSMWDSELVELLLTALADPHPPEKHDTAVGRTHEMEVARGSWLCSGTRRGSQVFVGSRASWHTITDDLAPTDG